MEKFLEQHRISEKTKKEEKERLKATKPDAVHAKTVEDVASLPMHHEEEEEEEVIKEGNAPDNLEASGKHHAREEEDGTASPSKKQKVDAQKM